jgi:hypothetical protein
VKFPRVLFFGGKFSKHLILAGNITIILFEQELFSGGKYSSRAILTGNILHLRVLFWQEIISQSYFDKKYSLPASLAGNIHHVSVWQEKFSACQFGGKYFPRVFRGNITSTLF